MDEEAQEDMREFRLAANLPEQSLDVDENRKESKLRKAVTITYNDNGSPFIGLSVRWSPWTRVKRETYKKRIRKVLQERNLSEDQIKKGLEFLDHAEAWLVIQLAENGNVEGKDLTIYVDRNPCEQCVPGDEVGGLYALVDLLGINHLQIKTKSGTDFPVPNSTHKK